MKSEPGFPSGFFIGVIAGLSVTHLVNLMFNLTTRASWVLFLIGGCACLVGAVIGVVHDHFGEPTYRSSRILTLIWILVLGIMLPILLAPAMQGARE